MWASRRAPRPALGTGGPGERHVQGNGSNPADLGNGSRFVTAMLKNTGQTTFALKGGNAQGGGLTTRITGAARGYAPMRQEGSIVWAPAGDNSNGASVVLRGRADGRLPDRRDDDAVQANIVSAGYSGGSGVGPGGTITVPGGKCVDVAATTRVATARR